MPCNIKTPVCFEGAWSIEADLSKYAVSGQPPPVSLPGGMCFCPGWIARQSVIDTALEVMCFCPGWIARQTVIDTALEV